MKRRISIGVVAAMTTALLVASGASALALTSPTWNLNGTYTIPFIETVGPDGPGPFPYSVTITVTSDTTGKVSGTGFYVPVNGPPGYPSVTVTGQVTGWDVELDLMYDDPNLSSYNPFVLTGAIDQYGGMSGTAADGQNRAFTWTTTTGSVSLWPSCDYGTYPDAAKVWDGFAPGTGEAVTTPALDPTRDYFVEASGTYFAGGYAVFDIQADAEYSQDAAQRAASEPWTDYVKAWTVPADEVLLDLMINDANVDWGPYNADHRYTIDVAALGSPLAINANIYDSYPSNNVGGLCVALFEKNYDFDGFFRPVDNPITLNTVKAGQAIPVKFSLDGDRGLDIFAAGSPSSKSVACNAFDDQDAIEQTVTAGSSSLQYDATTDTYTYVWKTLKTWAGACRQLVVKLADGTMHIADFSFTK